MPRAIRLTLQTGGGGGGGGGGAITATVRAADELLVLGRARVGLPRDRNQLHRRHAEVGWERGVPIVRRLGANQVGIIRGGLRLKVGMGVERGALEHGDALFFLLRSDGLQYSVAIVDEGEGEGDEANRAAGKRSADGDEAGQGQTRPAKLRRTEDEDEAWLEEQVAKVNAAPGILSLLPSGVRTNVQQIWSSFDPPELEDGIARFRQQQDSSSGEEKQRFTAMVDLMTACLERRRCQEANSRVAREGGHPPLAPATAATVPPALGVVSRGRLSSGRWARNSTLSSRVSQTSRRARQSKSLCSSSSMRLSELCDSSAPGARSTWSVNHSAHGRLCMCSAARICASSCRPRFVVCLPWATRSSTLRSTVSAS
jgi:hypothetical protein